MSSNPTTPVLDYAPKPAGSGWGKSVFGWILFIGLAVLLVLLVQKQNRPYSLVSYSFFMSQVEGGKVPEVIVEDNGVRGAMASGGVIDPQGRLISEFRVDGPQGASGNIEFLERLRARGVIVQFDRSQNLLLQIVLPLIPWLLIFGFIWFFVFRQLRKQTGKTQPWPVYMVPAPGQSSVT
jgi:ATP-dependent Zn protease